MQKKVKESGASWALTELASPRRSINLGSQATQVRPLQMAAPLHALNCDWTLAPPLEFALSEWRQRRLQPVADDWPSRVCALETGSRHRLGWLASAYPEQTFWRSR